MPIDARFVEDLSREAGRAILEVYGTDFGVERKSDRSPLTLADTRSHEIIARALRARYPEIPVLSEEGKTIPYEARRGWARFWLVDPLDGTKEFVKRNGEFTVNIALIEGARPVFGLIHVPVSGKTYVGVPGEGAYVVEGGARRAIGVRAPAEGEAARIVKSRSHPSPLMQGMLDLLGPHELVMCGSALKFCTVAEGAAHFYPRLAPTWEWDTGAGQAIVEAAGGVVVDLEGRPLAYNKAELLNVWFLCAHSLPWLAGSGVFEEAAKAPGALVQKHHGSGALPEAAPAK